MNYFEHHIGDYDQATAHLSAVEDGIYHRLIRLYMAKEKPLLADTAALQRLVRAHTRDEKAAVHTILGEFFDLREDGYHQHRCDEEIARFQDKSAKAKRSAAARWNGVRDGSDGNANASSEHDAASMRSHSEGNAPRARPQTPDTNLQNTPHTPKGAGAVGLKTWIAAVKAKGEQPIPETDTVFGYAREVGIPDEFLRLAWREFLHRYSQPDAKRYRDWRSVFRKAVRGNWLKLWWLDGQHYTLTTAGVQAQRAHQERAA